MKKRNFCLPLMLMTIVMAICSCSSSPDYLKMIPDDAVMVLRIDVKQIADKNGSDGEQVKQKLTEMLSSAEMSAEAREKVKAIISDPAEAGIDLRDPLLIYMTATANKKNGAILATIHDADKLAGLLTVMAKENGAGEVKTADGIRYLYDGNMIVAFDDNVLYCNPQTLSGNETEAAREAAEVLTGKKNYTFGESDFVKKMTAADGVMQCLVTGKIYEEMPEYHAMIPSLPAGADMKDVACLLDLEVEKGKAVLNCEMLAASSEWKKAIKDADDVYRPIGSDLIEYVSADGLALLLNCDGERLFAYMEANGFGKMAGADDMKQAKNLITTLDGNIALDLRGIDMRLGMPEMAFYAKTKSPAIVDLLGPMLGNKAKTGYDDGISYMLIGQDSEPFKAPANALNKGNAKGKRMYMYLNFSMIGNIARLSGSSNTMAINAASQLIETIEMTYEGDGKCEIAINMRDKDKNPIETITALVIGNIN